VHQPTGAQQPKRLEDKSNNRSGTTAEPVTES